MIEIAFSDSACGSLKCAQHYGMGEYVGGCVGVIVTHPDGSEATKEEIEAAQKEAEEAERLAWKNATPLGGDPADIYGFHLALSIGDISSAKPDIRRQQVLEWLWSVYPEHEGELAAQDVFETAKGTLNALLDRIKTGETIRIWYSNHPDELCGLYWFMAQLCSLGETHNPIHLVKLPEWEENADGNILKVSSWGEVSPGEWHRYVPLQKTAPPLFCESCAEHWKTLQAENAPLRAVLNGQLVSMPETLYDSFITREIESAPNEFQEAMLIGNILGKYESRISDTWVALRIEEMIRAGILEPADNKVLKDYPSYYRMLRKCDTQ